MGHSIQDEKIGISFFKKDILNLYVLFNSVQSLCKMVMIVDDGNKILFCKLTVI